MYCGTMVEYGKTEEVYSHAAHPYTQGLLSAVPVADPDYEQSHERIPMDGEVASPINPAPGCRFAGRCPRATEQCRTQTPILQDIGGGHFAACHHLQ
jgi:oligopeptide transport system ATP-binding protein